MAIRQIAGKDVFIYIGSVLVGCVQETSISVDSEMLAASCKSSLGWAESTPGEKSWSASLNGVFRIYTDPDDDTNYSAIQLFDAIVAGTKLTIKFGTTTTGDTQFSGDGYLGSWELTGSNGDVSTYSAELVGTGALSKITVP